MNVRNLGLVENWGPHVPYHAGNGLVLRLDRAARLSLRVEGLGML